MVNTILNAITRQLGKTFGMGYKYYVEEVPQGLVKPCFTVDMIAPRERSRSPILYDRTIPVVIHYHNDTKEYEKIGYSVAEKVIECLEYLPVGDTFIRGEDISWQFVEDVLQIFITYKFTTQRVESSVDDMEILSENVKYSQL